jgi:hypothetical protein
VMAGYTYSKTIDDASYDSEQPENPYAIGNERALSLMDQRYRFTQAACGSSAPTWVTRRTQQETPTPAP